MISIETEDVQKTTGSCPGLGAPGGNYPYYYPII